MATRIWVTTRFEAFHCWPEAPDEVSFLRDLHRHLFHVKATWLVSHDNRDLEFFIQLKKLQAFIAEHLHHRKTTLSCEQMALSILNALGCSSVEVSEDGENGAKVSRTSNKGENKKNGSVLSLVRTKPFVGTEAEGPNRGKKVLFIPKDSISVHNFTRTVFDLAVMCEVDRVYFGGGNRQWADLSLVNLFNELARGTFGVDVEVAGNASVSTLSSDVLIIQSFAPPLYPKIRRANLYYKWIIGDSYIVWQNSVSGQIWVTCASDSLYLSDKEMA